MCANNFGLTESEVCINKNTNITNFIMVVTADLSLIFPFNILLKDVKVISTRIFCLVEGLFFFKFLYS